jgi:Predicted nucleoside-diphosphate sugar epimerase
VNVTVFGATGVVGRALVPLLDEHELTAVSRTARNEPGPAGWSPMRRAATALPKP